MLPRSLCALAHERRQLRMEHFYRGMRKRTGLLMEADGPAGGAWNFDGDNRKPLPRQLRGPFAAHFAQDGITAAVVALVRRRFSDTTGTSTALTTP